MIKERALIVIPHFFNFGEYATSHFGSHQVNNLEGRKVVLNKSKDSIIREFGRIGTEFDLVYFGISGANILDLQVETTASDPRFLPWLAMDFAFSKIDQYDLLVVIEDDIELMGTTLSSLIDFNSQNSIDVTLIPNRLETFNDHMYCTDLVAMPGWKGPKFEALGLQIREPINIHSGFLLLSAERFRKAYESRPFKTPTQIIGDYMASAFANMHAFQKIVRAVPTRECVTVLHRDNWAERMVEYSIFSESEIHDRILQTNHG